MLGLIGFLKKKLDLEGKLPDKWKDEEAPIPSANPITYNEETHVLTLKAGQYLKDYKGRNRYVLQDINLDCALGSYSHNTGTYGLWLSFSSKWTNGYGVCMDKILSENYDGKTYYVMGREATRAFKIGECTGCVEGANGSMYPTGVTITFDPENYDSALPN